MDLFKKFYQIQGKTPWDLINQHNLVTDKDAKVFIVDSVHGSDSYGGQTMSSPLATIAKAYELCTTDNHDTILVLPRHAETTTAVLTVAKAGVSIIGLKRGNLRPILTCNAAIDNISVEAANVSIGGLAFAAPLTDAQTAHINIAGAYCAVQDCTMLGSVGTENMVNCITITAAGDNVLIEDLEIDNDVVEVVGAILFEGAFTNGTFRRISVIDEIGFTNGAIYDAAAATRVRIEDCFFDNIKANTAVCKFASNSTGYMNNCQVSSFAATIADAIDPGTGMVLMNVKVTDEEGKTGMDYAVDAD